MTGQARTLNGGLTINPVTIPAKTVAIAPQPEFIRLPPCGFRCPISGMSRGGLNELILPTPRNGYKPPVRSFCLRQRGAKTGIRLIDYQSLAAYIRAHVDTQTPDQGNCGTAETAHQTEATA